jgi:hypothetical protein
MSARVKHYSSALLHALKEERHFALIDGVAFPTVGSLVIVFQAWWVDIDAGPMLIGGS